MSNSAEDLKNFVIGHGITFGPTKKNQDAHQKALVKWDEIATQLCVNSNSVILFCGAKNNGKSSLARYIVNEYNKGKLYQQSPDSDIYAYYVDFDPGQPEMTTPGIVSAHLVSSKELPLTSPTYLNMFQHKPIVLSCVGGLNMSVDPRVYIQNCRFVFSKVKEHQAEQSVKQPIFINTMGYIRNVGLAMLMDLIKICSPTDLIALNVKNQPMRTIYADLSPSTLSNTLASFHFETCSPALRTSNKLSFNYHVHDLEFSFVESTSIATKNRIAQQIAYFSSIPEALYMGIMQVSPKRISLEKTAIYCSSSYPLCESIVLELLYHSWVHLVKLRRMPQQINPDGTCKIVEDIRDCIMFGCGIVANIDIEAKQIAIITPLSQETIDLDINCVIKPLSIQVPSELIYDDSKHEEMNFLDAHGENFES